MPILAQDARIRELELALVAHEGHVAALLLEREEASRSALARALVWATSKSEHSSNEGADYHDFRMVAAPRNQELLHRFP